MNILGYCACMYDVCLRTTNYAIGFNNGICNLGCCVEFFRFALFFAIVGISLILLNLRLFWTKKPFVQFFAPLIMATILKFKMATNLVSLYMYTIITPRIHKSTLLVSLITLLRSRNAKITFLKMSNIGSHFEFLHVYIQ